MYCKSIEYTNQLKKEIVQQFISQGASVELISPYGRNADIQ